MLRSVLISVGVVTFLAGPASAQVLDLVAVTGNNPFFTDQKGAPLDAPCDGQTVNVNFTYDVVNGPSPAVSVAMSIDGGSLCTVSVPAGNGPVTVSCGWVVSPGLHTVCGVVDSDGKVAESDESNNMACTTPTDCNGNGIPDECDITSGVLTDVDSNGVPDECGACCDTVSCDQALAAACNAPATYAGDQTVCAQACIGDVPTVSTWGVVIMLGLVIVAGTIVFRRVKVAT